MHFVQSPSVWQQALALLTLFFLFAPSLVLCAPAVVPSNGTSSETTSLVPRQEGAEGGVGAMGIGGMALSVISFGMSIEGLRVAETMYDKGLMPRSPASGEYSVVRVAAALDSSEQKDNGGKIDIRLFNAKGDLVGKPVTDKYVNEGNAAADFPYKHFREHRGQQPLYLLLTGNDDSICVAYSTVTFPGGETYVWDGNIALGCYEVNGMRQHWYYSGLWIQNGTHPYMPACLWLNKDARQGTSGFQAYLPGLSHEVGSDLPVPEQICDGKTFGTYKQRDPDHVDIYTTMGKSLEGRSQSPSPAPSTPQLSTDHRLVFTSREYHSARFLCEHPSSIGPTLANRKERLLCDLRTRTLWHFCEHDLSNECFDDKGLAIVAGAVAGRSRWEQKDVLDWDEV